MCILTVFGFIKNVGWTTQGVSTLAQIQGEGQIISGMQSRDFGFGLQISKEQLTLINASHLGQNYCDMTAAMEIYRSSEKKPLSELPFLCAITIGMNSDGFWTSYHMAVQLEDCVDCVKILYLGYNFVFCLIIAWDTVRNVWCLCSQYVEPAVQ